MQTGTAKNDFFYFNQLIPGTPPGSGCDIQLNLSTKSSSKATLTSRNGSGEGQEMISPFL